MDRDHHSYTTMRAAAASLFLIGLSFLRRVAEGHPLCYFDDRPTNFEQVLTFCPEPQDGACCNDAEEAMVEAIFTARLPLSEKCASYYKQVGARACVRYEILSRKTNLCRVRECSICCPFHDTRTSA